ncbi:MAG TPA: metallophosphoesterase family protein [Nocardioidaceae bacterium]|nr:metallophosphoesterase family protein [Nocardioidaceae bacterium]
MGALFVVSDVHGYRDDLVAGLEHEGLTDRSGRWTGGDADLWILGDLTDRGPDGIGVIDLVRSLHAQAPGQVHTLMGNHEILALGRKRFPDSKFASSWVLNGGLESDQEALTPEHLEWLGSLPVLAKVGGYLFMHSDTSAYLDLGDSVEQINAAVHDIVESEDVDRYWNLWAKLTSRYHFGRPGGPDVARRVLETLGAAGIVHGHSIIGSLIDCASSEVDGPVLYADGQVLAIDGGRYDGGPLLVVKLED